MSLAFRDPLKLSAKKQLLLEALRQEEGLGSVARIPARTSAGAAQLSFAQQRLWFLEQLTPGNVAYNMPMALRIHGPLNVTALQQSLSEIVRRHETLRTCFVSEHGRPVQRVAPAESVVLPTIDLSHLPRAAREAEARRLANEEAARPFDLTRAPLVRGLLIKLGKDHHVFLYTIHHIAADGWSLRIFTSELTEIYEALSQGRASSLPELSIQYADFAEWQREWLTGSLLDEQLSYWKTKLQGASPLGLMTDRPRPRAQTLQGERQILRCSRELSAALNAMSRRHGCTLYMVLLAAFDALLHRYTSQDDVVIGSLIANRNRAEIEGLIGFFVNSLVLRTDCSGDPTFRELLGRVREVTLGAYAHQDLPFERLVETLAPERDPSRSPIFQVLFALQNVPMTRMRLPGLRLTPFRRKWQSLRFDLEVSVWMRRHDLIVTFIYNPDLFDKETIGRMRKHYRTLLEGIVANPDRRLSELPLLDEAERRQLFVEGAAPRTAPADCPVHRRFEAQAAQRPGAVAVVFGDEKVTYRELNRRANRLAHALRGLGVGPETLVGLCVERSVELVVGILGILKAGGAYVPLDPDYPKERLRFILEDTRTPVVVTTGQLKDRLPEHGAKTVCVDSLPEELSAHPDENPVSRVRPEHLAYVIYTSGSTGQPKGVLVTHANVARLFTATAGWFDFSEQDVWSLFHSFAFDFSVWELWGALCHGGRLVIVPHLVSRSPEAFYDLLRSERVTVLNQTPSAFRLLIRAEESAGAPDDLALRLVIFGGEALDVESLRPWFDRHGDQCPRLVNMYGITETTVHVTYRPLTLSDLARGVGSPIGIAIPDLRVILLDSHGRCVPLGVPGEIHVGGAGVARGYLNRPELTAERFVADPFSREPGARLYKSGDLARYRADGTLEFLGRIDQQVKIRGFRIELGEIEAALSVHPLVGEAVVVAREEPSGDRRLVAYVVPSDGQAPAATDLRVFLKARLPDYMVPAAFVCLPALPLTPNGKIDTRALPAPELIGGRPDTRDLEPANGVERTISAIWQELLGVERIGRDDNFFDLGGHSLLVPLLHEKLREAFGGDLAMVELFEYPTVSSLAARVSREQNGGTTVERARHRAAAQRAAMARRAESRNAKERS